MGAIRLFLAIVVVIDHARQQFLIPKGIDSPEYLKLGMNAGFAVMFFFIVSGFLMSLVLNTKYDATTSGTLRFYESRFVRIFSLYWPLFAIILLFGMPTARSWLFDTALADKLTNLFIFGVDWRLSFAEYPTDHWGAALQDLGQAWTLGPELTFYLLAPFFLRSIRLSLGMLIASAICRAIAVGISGGFDNVWTYQFLPSTFLFFMLGHLAYVAANRWVAVLRARATGALLLISCASALMVPSYTSWDTPRFWIAVLCFAGALPSIFRFTSHSRWINALGDLSYPLYLVHYPLLHWVFRLAGTSWTPLQVFGSGQLAGISVLALLVSGSLLAAVVAQRLLERPFAGVLRRLCSGLRRQVMPENFASN